jgi:hypothetical protein
VVGAEAAGEMGIGDDAALGLADSCGAGEGARPRRETEQELGEEVLVVQRGRRRRGWLGGGGGGGALHLKRRKGRLT